MSALPSVREVKAAIGSVWTQAATDLGEPIRVIPRWKLSLRGRELLTALRSITDNLKTNGVYITRIKRKSKKVGNIHWEYEWTFAMFYFRTYDDGDDVSNSEDKMDAILEAVASGFESNPDIGIDEIEGHDEMQIENVDTMDLKVHAAQCFITVRLTKQP